MVAPVNKSVATAVARPRRGGAGRGATRAWLTPAAIARVCSGEVIRAGRAARTVVTDSRADCTTGCFVALRGPHHDGHEHVGQALERGARGLVVSRVPAELPRLGEGFVVKVPDTRLALLQLAAEHRRRHSARVVGITGSCGKTSTKEMLGRVLEAAMPAVRSPGSFNNQVGVPLTLFRIRGETAVAVVEIGTNAPGEVAELSRVAHPNVAIVTCVAAAHLQGLGSLEGVAREKADLVASVPDSGLCILNGDDAACRSMAGSTDARVQTVSLHGEADWFATEVRFHGLGTTFRLRGERPVTLPRLGTHNVYNALFALAAAAELGVPEDLALAQLAQAEGAERRLEPKLAGEVLVFDDTYNMNPLSARASLQALAGLPGPGRRLVVFGEMLELGLAAEDLHRELGADVHRTGTDVLVCVGEGAKAIADGARAAGMGRRRVHRVADVPAAQELVTRLVRPGDRLLCKASRGVALDRLVDGLVAGLRRNERRNGEGD